MKKRYAISEASVGLGARSTKSRKQKAESRKTIGSREDASITGTLKEDFLFLRDGWLGTSTGSSIEVRALQQEEGL